MNAPAPRSSVLKGTQISCMLPVIDIERARRFYGEQLGLEPVGAKASGKFVYRCGGTEVALFPKAGGTKATHSTLSFQVGDITAAIHSLEARGVWSRAHGYGGIIVWTIQQGWLPAGAARRTGVYWLSMQGQGTFFGLMSLAIRRSTSSSMGCLWPGTELSSQEPREATSASRGGYLRTTR